MRRCILAASCLLLGATTTVGMAWGCVWLPPSRAAWSTDASVRWPGAVPTSWPAPLTAKTYTAFGYRYTEAWGYTTKPASNAVAVQWNVEAGWPCRALQGQILFVMEEPERAVGRAGPAKARQIERWTVAAETLDRDIEILEESAVMPSGGQMPGWPGASSTLRVPLPLQVDRVGMLLDALLFSGLWWASFVTPGTVKRWRRRRRGMCISCGYSLIGLGMNQCPECGQPNPRSCNGESACR